MRHGARLQAECYRDTAAHFRLLSDIEPVASLRRQLQHLAARYDQLAAGLETPQSDDDGAPRAALR
jgi:hypothetical protein